MTSPLSIRFSTMCATSAAYSDGCPSRGGNGIDLPSDLAPPGRQSRQQRRVEEAGGDGAHADARGRQVAGRGQSQPDHAALRGAVGDLPDLAVVGGDGGGVDTHAALAVLERVVGQHGVGREAQDVEGPDQVDGDDDGEGLERVGPARAGDLLGESGAGAVHADAQRGVGLGGGRDGGLDLVLLAHVTGREGGAQLVGQRLALLGVDVGDRHRGALRVQAPRGRLAQPGGAADDQCSTALDFHGAPS